MNTVMIYAQCAHGSADATGTCPPPPPEPTNWWEIGIPLLLIAFLLFACTVVVLIKSLA